jgi:hypothetical protein
MLKISTVPFHVPKQHVQSNIVRGETWIVQCLDLPSEKEPFIGLEQQA